MTSPDALVAPDPIDWPTARKVARFVARRDALADSYLGTSLRDDFTDLTGQAEVVVARLHRLARTGQRDGRRRRSPRLGRRQHHVDAPAARAAHGEGSATRLARSPFAPIGRHVAATEIGALIGYMSQRVLGQYDLLVPDNAHGDSVYYVGPNILALEKRFAFRPRDFRLWIAIHEVTHRAQFAGVPWMRGALPRRSCRGVRRRRSRIRARCSRRSRVRSKRCGTAATRSTRVASSASSRRRSNASSSTASRR